MSKIVGVRFAICAHCGAKFCYEINPHGGGNHIYCSKDCARKAKREREKIYNGIFKSQNSAKEEVKARANKKSWGTVIKEMEALGFGCDYGKYQIAVAEGLIR